MTDVADSVRSRIETADPATVWTPVDFLDVGTRDAVDKGLQRLARAGVLRRIDRGLYDRPAISSLTKAPRTPDYRKVLDALARRDQARMLIDGLTAANDLGLTTAVPARVVVHTDMRRRSIPLGNLTDRVQAHGSEQAVLGGTASDAGSPSPVLAEGHARFGRRQGSRAAGCDPGGPCSRCGDPRGPARRPSDPSCLDAARRAQGRRCRSPCRD